MKISAIVPTLNAARYLHDCLPALDEADEVIVVDGGSEDATRDIARRYSARLIESARGRGAQLAAGAAATSGDALLFVHADTRLSPGWAELARRHLERHIRPACFRLRLDDRAWQARVIERGVTLRTRLFGLPYGDQGLLVRQDVYRRSGGYRPLPMMEDVELLERLPRPVQLRADAVTSAERWRSDGWARRSARNLACLALWQAGVSPERIAAVYHKPRRVSPLPGGSVSRAE